MWIELDFALRLLTAYSQFFPPAEQMKRNNDEGQAANEATATADDAVPELPDVPTQEPKEEGQPEAKKQKLDEGSKK